MFKIFGKVFDGFGGEGKDGLVSSFIDLGEGVDCKSSVPESVLEGNLLIG